MFDSSPSLNILFCQTCHGTGYMHRRPCPTCHTKSMGIVFNGKFVYFGQPLTRFQINLKRARRRLNHIRILFSLLFGCIFLGIFVWELFLTHSLSLLFSSTTWLSMPFISKLSFVLGIFFWSYLIYRVILDHREFKGIEFPKDYAQEEISLEQLAGAPLQADWSEVLSMSKKKLFDFSEAFTDDVKKVIEEAYFFADQKNHTTITPLHFFYALLDSQKIRTIFVRLGFPIEDIKKVISDGLTPGDRECAPGIGDDAAQILIHSYILAYKAQQTYIHVTELLVATVGRSPQIQEFLYDLGIDQAKLYNVVEWLRIQEYIRNEQKRLRHMAQTRNKYGLDRAMTAIATPYLNNFSQDLTLAAQYGNLSPCVAREKELEEIFRVVEAGSSNILLVGEPGVGKMSIIEGVAQKMVQEHVPSRLADKRFVQLSISALLAGTTISGAQERLIRIMHEVSRAKNIILFINNLQDLIGASGGQEGLDVSGTLAEYLQGGNFLVFATTTTQGYNKHIINSEVGSVFTRIDIEEVDVNQAIQVLESKVPYMEYKLKVFFSYTSLESAVKFAKRFFHDKNLPESAVELLTESGSFARTKRGVESLVLPEDVGSVVSQKTGIPVTSITQKESEKLLQLEQELHKRVIGQDEAVVLVANALRRARAEIRSTKKPIANFLFLGPTGVGKTELAKTIADVYFGAEDRMIRIDMSEYQDKSSLYRLIGTPGNQGTGILTEAVRQQPFSLILLDELEKADPDILNLFLQVFDEGHLTDSVGRKIDFTNSIIIATSNAGTSYVQAEIGKGESLENIRQDIIHGELQKFYRPEFLNRFDGIVLFKPLAREDVAKIARLMLKRVEKDLENKGMTFEVTDQAIEDLLEIGYNPEFGARPMRRAVQDLVENKLAELLLSGKLQRRDTIVFEGKDKIFVKSS